MNIQLLGVLKRQIMIQYGENTLYESLNEIQVWSMDGDRGKSNQEGNVRLFICPRARHMLMTFLPLRAFG